MKDYIIPLVIAIVGSGGFTALVTALIGARQRKKDKDDAVMKKLDSISKAVDDQKKATEERFIRLDRSAIIKFADEISRKLEHSSEAFDDILEAIDRYDKYCKAHDDFKNSKTTISAKLIKDTYERYRSNRNTDKGEKT